MNYVERIVARQQKEYKKEKYINFKDAIISKLNKHELEEKLQWLEENNYEFIKHTTIRGKMGKNTYSMTYNDHLIKLTVFDGTNYYWFSTNYHDDAKNVETPNSFKTFKNLFKKRTGMKMTAAFGKTQQAFKLYCPKPLYYISPLWEKCSWIKGVCKEDYSSHYPASALGILPDSTEQISLDQYVKPNEEYEFAFYPDTGHIAIYNEFDSHDYISYVKTYSAKVSTKYKTKYEGADKHTILMKRSQYNLVEEIMFYYNIKTSSNKDSEEYHNAKMFLLKFIGSMEQVNSKLYASHPYAHIAAVIKWRANIKMFNTIKNIGFRNVVQVCVDGIIHVGEPVGSNNTGIGELITETTNAKFIQRGINQYILKGDNFREIKHTGLDVNIESENIATWMASPKIDFLTYIKNNYNIEELLWRNNYGKNKSLRSI